MEKRGRIKLLPHNNAPLLRLNSLCPYFTMFPLEFPFKHLTRASIGDWILDPFCGRGTTNFAARLLGLNSIGIDSSPVAFSIAAAKFAKPRPKDVIELCHSILDERTFPRYVPSGDFWSMCFHRQTLIEICKIREYLLEHCKTDREVALRGLMLGILHGPRNKRAPSYLSNQMPRTYSTKPTAAVHYWRKCNLAPVRIKTTDVVTRRAFFSLQELPPKTAGKAIHADSRSYKLSPNGQKYRWVVTSPPYYGMRTYLSDQWVRHWFLGGADCVNYIDDSQISHDKTKFAQELGKVWANIAAVCNSGARLIVRFGALPSIPCDAREILKQSLRSANCGWRILTMQDAGSALLGRRQSTQFRGTINIPFNEIDMHAILEV